MAEHYRIAIVGSGPGGMSAAGRCAEHGVPHILLERTDHLSDTIYKYQKGKHVMATPDVLPLRSTMSFEAGKRETILDTWNGQIGKCGANVRFKAEVTSIKGERGNFEITINRKETITAEAVILAIGLQGNLRQMECDGADWEGIQYQLDDPDAYEDETVVVIGAGDAAIENAVALARQNKVAIINRRDEFARAKDGNRSLIEAAISSGAVECYYNADPARVAPGELTLTVADGEAVIKCDRIIARLGAIPPRKFVESCGIEFPSKDPSALPELSGNYESNVPGLYIIGALGGYPLIKQAMNQGYEVVEFILGNPVKPADEPLLEEKFGPLLEQHTVDDLLDHIRQSVPLLAGLTTLQLREFLIDSTFHFPKPGDTVFERNDYTNSFFMIVEGAVDILINPLDDSARINLGKGNFFGEMGLLQGRRRTATVLASDHSILLESPRRTMIKTINSVASVEKTLSQTAIIRQLLTYLSPNLAVDVLGPVVESAKIRRFKKGGVLFNEGEEGDGVYLIQRGSVTVSRKIGGQEVIIAYVPAGHYVGEMALLNKAPRNATVRAAVATETIWLEGDVFQRLMEVDAGLRREVEDRLLTRLIESEAMEARPEAGSIIQFLVEQGIGEATDMLLIDESLCIACDNCEKACAETHGGTSRLDREAGPTFATIHVPTSCRHCEHPHCMADCPPDAIHRAPDGEVFIDESCIGCGNCERNCPYGVIHMAYPAPEKPGLLSWLLFGVGYGPGEDKHAHHDHKDTDVKRAVKCDMCKDIEGGPSCVRACPTGAAIRVSPEEFFSLSQLVR